MLGRQRKKRRLDLQRTSYANRMYFGRHVASRFINNHLEDFADNRSNRFVHDDASCTTLDGSHSTLSSTGIDNGEDVQDTSQQENLHTPTSEDVGQFEITSSDDTYHSTEEIDEPSDWNEHDSIGMLNIINIPLMSVPHHNLD